ncbi:MAG: HTH domain-containing protein [Solirubrobacterales bacterium]|nr:HTH domain-containing protein [Solirubrobacterales bacterium]MBV9536712.1 HTH domain-containing protein [Solirubrobacterales bacterium]
MEETLRRWHPSACSISYRLQSGPSRSARELADALGVTARTVRRDVDRLRSMAYPVEATHGSAGGYRRAAGAAIAAAFARRRRGGSAHGRHARRCISGGSRH